MVEWPALPYLDWRDTRDTLHMYTQVIGKLRLALSPFEPEWANVPLYVTARGLTTSPMPVGLRSLEASFDFLDHELVLQTSDGKTVEWPLGGSVADFYRDVVRAVSRLGVHKAISKVPSEVPDKTPFSDDHHHHTYEASQVRRFFEVLSMVDIVFREHHSKFRGKTTPVQFFWGSFDVALTRFSGKFTTPPQDRGFIARYGGDAEAICGGWWPGDERNPHPAFYAYAYPPIDGLDQSVIRPAGAAWSSEAGEFLMPYETARGAPDTRRAILEFLESTYEAAAKRLGWSDDLTHFDAPPPRRPSARTLEAQETSR